MGLVVEIPLYTVIAVLKSPYMLFKGWYRLIHDLISREGLFLETACIPVAGLTILMWPLVVIGSIVMAIFSSFFIGLYGAVVLYQVILSAIFILTESQLNFLLCELWILICIFLWSLGKIFQARSCLYYCNGGRIRWVHKRLALSPGRVVLPQVIYLKTLSSF